MPRYLRRQGTTISDEQKRYFMIGILLTTVLSTSPGQITYGNPMESNLSNLAQNGNLTMFSQNGMQITQPPNAYAGGGFPSYGGGSGGYGGARGGCEVAPGLYTMAQGSHQTAGLCSETGGGIGLTIQGRGPTCNRGSYCALIGTYIGPYPTASVCAQPGYGYTPGYAPTCQPGYGGNMGGGYGMGYGGQGGFGPGMMGGGAMCGPPIILPPGYRLVKDDDKEKEKEKERKEFQKQLDDIKGTLEKEIKGSLDKLNESLKLTDKRLEGVEKVGLGTEARVKLLKAEFEKSVFWHDMENKLDQRIKPLEERLKELYKNLDAHDERLRRQHEQMQHKMQEETQRRLTEETQRRLYEESIRRQGAAGKADDSFKSIEAKIDRMQGIVLKDVSQIMLRLEEFEDLLNKERALRVKIEERLKNIEKSLTPAKDKEEFKEVPKDKEVPKEKDVPKDKDPAPKEKDAPKEKAPEKDPKDKEGATGLPKVRLAQVSLAQPGVPANQALVVVSVPADARLFLNNQLTRAQGTTRTFVTPELEPGGTFSYTFRMEVVQNGAVRTQTQEVSFQPGRRVTVVFESGSDVRVAGGQK